MGEACQDFTTKAGHTILRFINRKWRCNSKNCLRRNGGFFASKEPCSAPNCSGGVGVSRLSAGNLVGAHRCLFDLGFDLSGDPLCRRDHAPILNGRGSLHHLRGISLRAASFQGDPRPEAAEWRSAVIIGIFLLVGGNGGVAWAEQFVTSSLAALLVATVP